MTSQRVASRHPRGRGEGAPGPAGDPGGRRLFRLFIRRGAEATPETFDRTPPLLVTREDPALAPGPEVITVIFDDVRGLGLGSYTPGTDLHVRVHGATENADLSFTGPESGTVRHPDISEDRAETTAEMTGGR